MGSSTSYSCELNLKRKEGSCETLLCNSSDIYYDDGYEDDDEDGEYESTKNESISSFVITQEFIDSLKVGDILQLVGNGDCY